MPIHATLYQNTTPSTKIVSNINNLGIPSTLGSEITGGNSEIGALGNICIENVDAMLSILLKAGTEENAYRSKTTK